MRRANFLRFRAAGEPTRSMIIPTISSRTPEGFGGDCPICGARVYVSPAEPLSDAPCPQCGVLLWPLTYGTAAWLFARDALTPSQRAALRQLLAKLPENPDSLDAVELIMELDETLDIQVPDDVAERFTSLDDLLRWLAGGPRD